MKKDDIVTISDPSYSMILEGGKLVPRNMSMKGVRNVEYIVVATNDDNSWELPTFENWRERNNTIIQKVSNPNGYTFTHQRYLRLKYKLCVTCGQEIKTLS